MRPLKELPVEQARRVQFVLCDIDDTLTDNGRLSATAYSSMERLKRVGFNVVPVTGRPAGWCDLIARQWPVDGVVGENGAFYFRYNEAERTMQRRYWYDAATRRCHRSALEALAQRILGEVPGSTVAADQPFRESDLAIDYCEDVPRLPDREVERIQSIFEAEGARAKVSSIHVNGWFGDNDKSTMSRILLEEIFGYELSADAGRALFVGDSPNDCPMFASVGQSVGVANVREFAGRLAPEPMWVTDQRGGAGFAEVVDHLVAARAENGET